MSHDRPVISSARLIALCTLSSRATGLVRDMLLMQMFGLGWILDAWNYAFQIPNLFRRLFGEGALSAVFVPTFTRTLERDGKPAAWALFARTLALLTITLSVVTGLILLAIAAIWQLAPAGDAALQHQRSLLLGLTALMAPFMITICVVALFCSLLNSLGSFVPAALTPAVLNVLMMLGVIWIAPTIGGPQPERQVFVLGVTVLVAGVLQLAFLLPALRVRGVKLGWQWAPRDPVVRGMLLSMGPVALGQGILLVSTFLDAQACILLTRLPDGPASVSVLGLEIAYPLRAGALSALTVAQRLYQFPLGILAISLATAALPMFSRLAAREQWADWSTELRGALRLAVFSGLLAGAMMIIVPGPIVRLLFEYKQFSATDTARAAQVLAIYGFGLWAFSAQHIVLRGFYSLGDVRTPLVLSAIFVPVNLALSLTLVWRPELRVAAFALSSTITASANVIVGVMILHRRTHSGLIRRELVAGLLRMLAATVIAVGVVWGLRWAGLERFADGLRPALIGRAIDVAASLGVGTFAFLVAGALLGLPEPRLLLLRGARRGKPPTA